MPNPLELTILLTAIAMGAVGQIAMKAGMNQVRKSSGDSLGPIIQALPKMFSNLFVLLGIAIYLLSTVLWLWVLSKVPLSFAYPMISLSYVIIIIAGKWIFKERIDIWKITAIVLILAGVVALGYSEPKQKENIANLRKSSPSTLLTKTSIGECKEQKWQR